MSSGVADTVGLVATIDCSSLTICCAHVVDDMSRFMHEYHEHRLVGHVHRIIDVLSSKCKWFFKCPNSWKGIKIYVKKRLFKKASYFDRWNEEDIEVTNLVCVNQHNDNTETFKR